MSTYTPGPAPQKLTAVWVYNELKRIAAAFQGRSVLHLDESHAPPERPRDGDVVFADGTNWNPGAGRGFYGYYSGAWVKLG